MASKKEIEAVEVEAVEVTPEVTPEVAPTPVAEKHVNPIIQMAIDQAAYRLARETAK